MAIQPQDLRNLIVGTLKLVAPTEKRDSSKRVIWKAECSCGEFEYGARPELEKYAGHCDCPGHPFKGKEKLVEGFKLNPDIRDSLDHAEAARDWELKRNPVAPSDYAEEVGVQEPSETPETITTPDTAETPDAAITEDSSEQPETTDNKEQSPKASDVLSKRLGLTGYISSSLTLTQPVEMLGCKAEKVVFAKQIAGDDLVLLHVQLVNADGKHSIASSKRKVPTEEWSSMVSVLAEMKIVWRERESKSKAKAA